MDNLDYEELITLPKNFDYSYVTNINISDCGLESLSELKLERFINLKELDCSYNKLKNLDDLYYCTSLRTLDCDGNELENLNGLINCTSLRKLYCALGRLKNLDGLSNCTSLKLLSCTLNQISNLNGLSNCTSLKTLACNLNKIENLDGIANCTSLYFLWCTSNRLKTLLPIRNLKNLREIYYGYNLIEGSHHPSVSRILDRDKTINIYSNQQNVHDSEVNSSINSSINNLLKVHSNNLKSEQEIINKLGDLNFPRIEDILKYFSIHNVHPCFNITYFEIFQLVFAEIESLNFNPEILKRLEEELNDASCMCFTERIYRTINSLNGFSDLVSINISETSQINAVMSLIKNDFENNKIKKEELLDTVRNRLEEYNTKNEIIKFYQSIFSEMYLE